MELTSPNAKLPTPCTCASGKLNGLEFAWRVARAPLAEPGSIARCARTCSDVSDSRPVPRARHTAMGRRNMNEEVLNTSVRKFLKKLGVTAQREIEKAVRDAVSSGRLKGRAPLPAKAAITVGGIALSFEVDGAIELE